MTMRVMVERREVTSGEASSRTEASARDASASQRKGCETWFRPLSRRRESGFPSVRSGSTVATNANADANRLPRNELRQDRQKWPKNGRPARTPHRTRPILLGSRQRLLHNPKTLNELRRARFGLGWLDCPIWHKSGVCLAWAGSIDEE